MLPFNSNKKLKIKFKHLVRQVYNEAYVNSNYKTVLIKHDTLKPYFKQWYFLQLFNAYNLTSKGLRIQSELQMYLNKIDKTINEDCKIRPKVALKTITELGGNIFLLHQLDIKSIKSITLTSDNISGLCFMECLEDLCDFMIAFDLESGELGHASSNFGSMVGG